MQPTNDGLTSATNPWQRTSIWALLPLALKELKQWIAVLAGGTYLVWQERFQAYLPWFMAGMVLLIAVSTWLNWRMTQFRVSTQGIELRRGLWQKEQLVLVPSRIQELQVQQPFYLRPLGLFALSLDSAGSQQQEFSLTGLTAAQLAYLQGDLNAECTQPSTPFYRVWLATLYNQHLWLPLLAVFGMLQSQFDYQQTQHWLSNYTWLLPDSLWLQGVLGIGFVALVISAMTLIWLYPQRVSFDGQQLQLQQGTLLTKTQRIPSQRLQMLRIRQACLARLFGHFSMIFHGFTNAREQKTKFAVLGQTAVDVDQHLIAQRYLAWQALQQVQWQRYPQAYFQRLYCLRFAIVVLLWFALVCIAQLSTVPSWVMFAGIVLTVWSVLDVWAYQRWHGFVVVDQVLYLWQGGLNQQWSVLPLRQIEKIQMQQSPFFRQQHWATLRCITANGSLTLAALPNQAAQHLYAQVLALLYSVEQLG